MRFTGSKGNKQKETDIQTDIQGDRKKPFGPIHGTEYQVTPVCPKFQTRQANPSFSRFPSDSPFYCVPSGGRTSPGLVPKLWDATRYFHPVVNKTKSILDYFFVALCSLNLCCQTGGISDRYFLKRLRLDRVFKNRCIPVPSRSSLNKMTLVYDKHIICKDDHNFYEHLVFMSNNKCFSWSWKCSWSFHFCFGLPRYRRPLR